MCCCLWKIEVSWRACRSWVDQKGRQGQQRKEISYLTLASIRSQRRVRRWSIMWLALGAYMTRRGALFWTFWCLFRRYWGHPERRDYNSPVVKDRRRRQVLGARTNRLLPCTKPGLQKTFSAQRWSLLSWLFWHRKWLLFKSFKLFKFRWRQ